MSQTAPLGSMAPFVPREIIIRRCPAAGLPMDRGQIVLLLRFDADGRIISAENNFLPGECQLEVIK